MQKASHRLQAATGLASVTMLFMAAFLFDGCIERKLNDLPDTGTIRIFAQAPEDETGTLPQNVTASLFDSPEGTVTLVAPLFETSSYATLPLGDYRILSYAYSADKIEIIDQDSFETATAYIKTETAGTKADSQSYIYQPEYFYLDHAMNPVSVALFDTLDVVAKPKNTIKSIKVMLSVSGDLSYVDDCSLILGGLANGITLCTAIPVSNIPEGSTIYTTDISRNGYIGTFNTFGVLSGERNLLNTGFTFRGAGHSEITTDLTQALKDINRENIVGVTVNLKMEVKKDAKGCFTMTLKDWTYVYYHITAEEKS